MRTRATLCVSKRPFMIAAASLLAAVLPACSTASRTTLPDVASYQAFLNKLPADGPDSIRAATEFFHELFAHGSQRNKDAAFLAFRDFFYANIEKVNEQYDNNVPKSEEAMESLITRIYGNGLSFWAELGIAFIRESDSFLADTFASEVSPPLREYLLLRRDELKEPYDNDGVLEISFKQLAQRCLNWDRYLAKYPKSPLKDQAEYYYRDYLQTLLLGMPNCPVLDSWWKPENKSPWLDEAQAAYAHVIQEHPRTKTARIIREYYPLVRNSAFSRSPKVEQFLEAHEPEYSRTSRAAELQSPDCGFVLTPDEFRSFWRSAQDCIRGCAPWRLSTFILAFYPSGG